MKIRQIVNEGMTVIEIHINGEPHQLAATISLTELLKARHIEPQSIAVVVNEIIIPRSQWPQHQCEMGDVIELFSAVAGG